MHTTFPIAANVAHRDRGAVSADGDGNMLESIDTAAIMKLGAVPHAEDPERPTIEELDAIGKRFAAY